MSEKATQDYRRKPLDLEDKDWVIENEDNPKTERIDS